MIALCFALVGLCAALAASAITLGVWMHGASKDKDHLRDLVDEWKSGSQHLESDLRVALANVQVLTDELESTKQLLAITQRQRDEVLKDARDNFVQRIQATGSADAAKLVSALLAIDLRTGGALGVLSKVPDLKDPRDALIDPFTPP